MSSAWVSWIANHPCLDLTAILSPKQNQVNIRVKLIVLSTFRETFRPVRLEKKAA